MRRTLYATVGVCLLVLMGSQAWAGPAEQAVQTSLAAQQRWLGEGEVREGWNEYLMTEELREQLERGPSANRGEVERILERYQSDLPGLDRPRFAAVRRSLEAWVAALPEISAEELPEAVEKAKDQYSPPRPERLQAARARLQQALSRLNNFLARGGRDRQAGWQTYLETKALQDALATDKPDVQQLRAIEDNYFQNETGLDLPVFQETRDALRDYANNVLAVSEEDPRAAYEARLDELRKRLEAYANEQQDDDAVAIGNILDYLSSTRQAQPLVRAIRRQYSQPNLYGFASERLIAAGVNRPVNQVAPVREVILGTDIHGTAHTVGYATGETIPNSGSAALRLVMNGRAYSNNLGYNGPVTICSTGNTTLCATKAFYFDANGLHSQPTVAVADTDTTITGISARHRLVERIASRRAAQQEGEAEAIASQRAARRLENSFEARAMPDLRRLNNEYQERFRRPLLRRGEFPELLDFATTHESVYITALQAQRSRIGAPAGPPRLNERADLAVRVHESMVGNAGETGLGGRLLTDEDVAELMEELTGEVPEELQITEDKDPWSITFSQDRPVQTFFDDDTVTIRVHGLRFTRGDRVIRRDMIISAKYRLEKQGRGSKLTRDGEVVADYVDQERLSVGDVAFKTFIRKKFEALFKPEFESEGLKLPGRWADIGRLQLRHLSSDRGWLTLAWEMPEQVERPDAVASSAR